MTRPIWLKIPGPDSLGHLLLIAFLLRLAIIPLLYYDFNNWAFGVFTNFFIHGQDPYHIVAQDPTLLFINIWRYPPLFLLFTAPALMAGQLTGQTLVYIEAVKMPFAIADVVSGFYLFKILARFLPSRISLKFVAFFVLNPVVLFESLVGGFNDPIPIALTVASYYYLLKSQDESEFGNDFYKSALLLGLGISAKIYPLLLVPILLRGIKGTSARIVYTVVSLVPAIAMSLPFFFWDWHSYIDILAIRNVGGQHPLFPGLEFSGLVSIAVAAIIVISIVFVYVWRLPLLSRVVLLFLWVNVAVFAQSFNYLVWGVPFFTLFVAEHRKWFWMPLSPVITMLVALVFQGAYDAVGGSTGIFYLTYHLFQLDIVPFRGSFLYGPLVFTGLLVGEVVGGYYFLGVAHFKPQSVPLSNFTPSIPGRVFRGFPRTRFLGLTLCLLAAISWSGVAAFGNFPSRHYPVVEGTSFQFEDDFHTGLLDAQWVFDGNGSYIIDPSHGTISLVSKPGGSASIVRGYAGVTDGFHNSSSAEASFLFKFDALLPGAIGMTLANMTDGQLVVRKVPSTSFAYVDQLNNNTTLFSEADNNWHNFTILYRQAERTIMIDGATWTYPGGTFARFILGSSDSRPGFQGSVEFSSVRVRVDDFPTGYQSQFAAWLAVGLPALFTVLLLASQSQRVKGVLARTKVKPLLR